MASLSTESTPRERLARLITVFKRVRMYWRGTVLLAGLGLTIALVVALHAKRAWRSEATILYRDTLQTNADAYAATTRAARLGPKLKDMLQARGNLSRLIEELGLYPEKSSRSMIEAVTEMQSHFGFRARDSDTYVISFVHDDPAMAQRVTARLAELLIEDYRRENLDTATLTLNFLRRELEEASARVDQASRALSTFLAKNPKFQWGVGDSPYAPPQGAIGVAPGGPAGAPAAPRAPRAAPRPVDPELAALEQRLAHIDAQLSPPRAAPEAPPSTPASLVDAQRARDAAAAALVAAEATLAERLHTLTPLHPDAVSAKIRVESARRELAAADAALRLARAGVTRAPEVRADLGQAQREPLEGERSALLRQIAARRQRVMSSPAAAPAEPRGPAARAPAPVDDIVELETEWHRLRLELNRASDYLKSVETNERVASMQADAAEKRVDSEMAILDPAYLPTKPDRGRGRVFFAGAAFSLLFAFGLAGARVLLNDTLYDEGDFSALGGPPVLAAVPRIPVRDVRERAMVPVTPAEPEGPADVDLDAAAEPPAGAGPGAPAGPAEPARKGADRAPPTPRSPRAGELAVPNLSRAVTLRFGSPLLPPGGRPGGRAGAPGVMLAVVGPRAAARATAEIHPEPELEVIGADVDCEGDGVFELLRGVPPSVLSALRVLRHRLDQRRAGDAIHPDAPGPQGAPADGHLVVSVVSPGPLEGKTALAGRLALTLAEAERARVILIEGNLERPSVAASLGVRLPAYAGLSYQLRQRMLGKRGPLGVVNVGPTLSLLAEPPGGAAHPGVLHSPHFGAAVRMLRRYYDYVVIDGPPVLGAGDANVIEDVSDGVLLIARASMTRTSDLARAAEQLGPRRILGVVLNDVAPRPAARKKAARPAVRAA